MGIQTITIVGGGLAGLSLGLALRREDIPVRVIEAGTYPRHRVCGEFISGRGLEVLAELDILPALRRAGGREASTARFHWQGQWLPQRSLPEKAFCISRFVLDALLLRTYVERGGTVEVSQRWTKPFQTPGVVRATGRRPIGGNRGRRWMGLKVHVHGVDLESDLEMHVEEHGYVGLCRVEGDRVNVCGLFHDGALNAGAGRGRDIWTYFESGLSQSLRARMASARWDDDSRCAIAGLPIHVDLSEAAVANGECAIGDALGMIPPLTGNGMSMALESGSLACAPLAGFARGEIGWDECCRRVARLHRLRLGGRLRRANRLHRVLFDHGTTVKGLLGWGVRSNLMWNLAFRSTR